MRVLSLLVAVLLGSAFAGAQTAKPAAPVQRKAPAKGTSPAFEKLVAQATEARKAEQWEQAIALYAKAVKLRPKYVEGYWYQGTAYYTLGKFGECRDQFRKVVKLAPKNGAAFAFLGLCEFEMQEYALSLQHLLQSRELGVGDTGELGAMARFHAAMLMTLAEQYEQALETLGEFAAEGNDSPPVIEAMGIATLRMPVLAADLPPERREMVMMAGRASYMMATRNTASAEQAFEALAARYPETPNVHYAYAICLLIEKADKAIEKFKRELELQPGHPPSMIQLAFEYENRGDAASALDWARKAVAAVPKDFAAHKALGQALLETGQSERGLAALRDAAAQAAEGGDAQTHARARLSLHWAERFAALPPGWSRSTADAVSALASELEAAGDEAGVARAWTMLASLLALQGQVEEARRLAERALEALRRNGDARGAREALRVVADAFVWGPTPVDAAVARLEQAAAEDVPLALETALRARVAALRAAGGDAAGARADLATAERLAAEAGIDPTPVLYWRGIAELWLGDAEAAERTLGTARAAVDAMMRTAWATVPGLLAEACCRLGRYDDAARCAAECREFAADHDLQAQLLWRTVDARILARRGDYEQATALARGALALAEGSTATALLGDAELALTEVRLCAADVEGSTAAATRASEFYAAKGMTAWEAKARRQLDELAAEPLPQGA